jgi:hypothetical protein
MELHFNLRGPHEFISFSKLSPEMRLMIWNYAGNQPRLVNIRRRRCPFCKNGGECLVECPVIFTAIPAVFHVNFESRGVAMRIFSPMVSVNPLKKGGVFRYVLPQLLLKYEIDTIIALGGQHLFREQHIRPELRRIRSLAFDLDSWCSIVTMHGIPLEKFLFMGISPRRFPNLEEFHILSLPILPNSRDCKALIINGSFPQHYSKSTIGTGELKDLWAWSCSQTEVQEKWVNRFRRRIFPEDLLHKLMECWKWVTEYQGVERGLRVYTGVVRQPFRAWITVSEKELRFHEIL